MRPDQRGARAGAVLTAVAALALAGCGRDAHRSPGSASPSAGSSAANTTPRASTPAGPRPGSTSPPVRLHGLPRPDHVVVVVLENHAVGSVIGSAQAPYLNQLARGGALFTRSFAVAHPSEPNYLALFAGSTEGVTDDSCPLSLTGPNLASVLAADRLTFTGFSEDLPGPGFTGCSAGGYARKHAPWVDFSNVTASAGRPFAAFPHDYATLPTVSFVVPNLQHDMHDGTIGQADDWVRTNLSAYADWADSHRSLLVVTFDEDDRSSDNHIATVLVGARVRPGRYDERIDHYRLLSTITAAYGTAAPGAARTAAPITSVWTP